MKKTKIAVIGGDARSARLAELFVRDLDVYGYMLSGEIEGVRACSDPYEATSGARAIILPLPATKDGKTVFSVNASTCALSDITSSAERGTHIIGGLSEKLSADCESAGLIPYSLLNNEALLIKNALLTAEGMLEYLLRLPHSIFGSTVLILGYGRVAQAAARVLRALGAKVYASARKSAQRALAECEGCSVFPLDSLEYNIPRDLCAVINTVPAPVLNEGILSALPAGTKIIELASVPCCEPELAKRHGIEFILAPALPGRCSPDSAADIIYKTVTDRFREVDII